MSAHVAVFVDGENINAEHAAAIKAIGANHGTVDVARVYGNAATLPGWSNTPGYRLIHSGTGKNATDILLVVQAMDQALSRDFGAIVIASSDRDFTHLAARLRERGLTVIGVGEAKTPQMFRAACSRFHVLHTTAPQPEPAPPERGAGPITALDENIRRVIQANSKNGQGMRIVDLAPIMHTKHRIKITTYPERNWRAYLSKRADLFDLDPKGPEAKVRFKPKGFASSS